MKYEKCRFCGSKLVKVIGSDKSCTNKYCKNFKVDDKDSTFLEYTSYKNYDDFDKVYLNSNPEEKYCEEYDKYLYFSDRECYISRFEYRMMNNFIENRLFEDNKIASFKNFVNRKEFDNFEDIEFKYQYINRGRDLEKENPKRALSFYSGLLYHHLFINDYYIYKKVVKLEKDPNKQLDTIISFFYSGIYCNRYHYLWFLKKLMLLSNKIDIPDEIIDDCLNEFKSNGFKKKEFSDTPVPIAEKITLNSDVLKVRTEEKYTLKQYRYEIIEEVSNLNRVEQYEYSTKILESLILNQGFKSSRIYTEICNNYRKLDDFKNELRWVFGFLSKNNKFKNKNYDDFLKRLDKMNVKTNNFHHNELFFDTNKYYLSKEDFKDNTINYCEISQYINLIKLKDNLILEGLDLEATNREDAIDYYISILDHDLFKNDYYVYKKLVTLYDQSNQMDELEKELDVIFSFFNSGIYCDRYNYLFFLFHLKKLSQFFVIEDFEINGCLKLFKDVSFKNKHLENTPAPLSERLYFRKNELKIIPGEDFDNQQDLGSLDLELQLFKSANMLGSMNEILELMIEEYGIDDIELYKQLCHNYHELNDIENEMRIITRYLDKNSGWNFQEQKWFENRLSHLKNVKKTSKIIKEPEMEIFYENNSNYLTFNDFKNNNQEFTELLDKLILKLSIRREGKKLESGDYQKTVGYYSSFLNHYLFKDDYYIYRKLVIYYEKLNDFESMWDTIKSFFISGINCTRYQYIWFLHKIDSISKVMFISDDEINECLKNFKENGFKNKDVEKDVFLAERLYYSNNLLRVYSPKSYSTTQENYALKEEAGQLELNGAGEESVEILRNLIDNSVNDSPRQYMRLCHMYRRLGRYKEEKDLINVYLASTNRYSKDWFEKKLIEVNELIKNG